VKKKINVLIIDSELAIRNDVKGSKKTFTLILKFPKKPFQYEYPKAYKIAVNIVSIVAISISEMKFHATNFLFSFD